MWEAHVETSWTINCRYGTKYGKFYMSKYSMIPWNWDTFNIKPLFVKSYDFGGWNSAHHHNRHPMLRGFNGNCSFLGEAQSLNPGIFAVAPEHDWIKAIPYVSYWTPEVTISIFWLDQSTWHAHLSHHGNLVSMYRSCSENWGHSMWFLKPTCFVFVALIRGPHFSPAMVSLVTSKRGLSLRGRAIGRLRSILNHSDLLKLALQIYYRNLQ